MTVSIDELEVAAADGWRAPEEAALGGWRLRAAGGFTGRANSALASGDPGMPLAEAADEVCRWYRARGLPPRIAIAFPAGAPQDSAVDRFLAARGWAADHGAVVMTAAPHTVTATAAEAGMNRVDLDRVDLDRVDLDPEPDEGWLALYRYRGGKPPPVSRRLLISAPWQAFGSVREDGRTIAIGRVAAARGWAGLTAIEVDPAHRRRGLGGAITGALVAAAARRGVTGIYLQVAGDNDAARSLYRRAGFVDHHEYHYRVAPDPTAG
jgi:N-acetylglutamate synthase